MFELNDKEMWPLSWIKYLLPIGIAHKEFENVNYTSKISNGKLMIICKILRITDLDIA